MANLATEPGVVNAALIAAPARVELVEGVESDVYACNGRVPGPTLELREGDRVTIRFSFTVPMGTAGTYWYHPHPHHSTGSQVGRGLYGAVVIRAAGWMRRTGAKGTCYS